MNAVALMKPFVALIGLFVLASAVSERLSMTALELIRDIFDRTGVGVI
jgi:hypothetical protein